MKRKKTAVTRAKPSYDAVLAEVIRLVQDARRIAARSVNSVMTAVYWEIGHRIVEHEQGGAERAGYGEALLARLSHDLTRRLGRGFSADRLETARLFYLAYSAHSISATVSRKSRPGRRSPKGWREGRRLSHHSPWAEASSTGTLSSRSMQKRGQGMVSGAVMKKVLTRSASPARCVDDSSVTPHCV